MRFAYTICRSKKQMQICTACSGYFSHIAFYLYADIY